MKVCVCSCFRNATAHLDRYLAQLGGLRRLLAPQGTLHPIWVEGDSTDATWEWLLDDAPRLNARLIACDHGGPVYGSIVHPERFRQLAWVANAMWRQIPANADAVVLLDGDLFWQPETIVALLDHLADYPAVAPRVLHATNPGLYSGPGPFWYDSFGFRRNGARFTNEPPYHPDLNGAMLQLDSAGGCLAMRGELAHGLVWPEEEVIVGFCRSLYEQGGSIWLDPTLTVYHP